MSKAPNHPLMFFVFALLLTAGAAFAQNEGESLYTENCVACHQEDGEGQAGAFPPLANGNVSDILAAEGGRTYLVNVLLYGLNGEITVQGETYDGDMQSWSEFSDEEIAAVLNYIASAWDQEPPEDFEQYEAAEIEAERGNDLAPSDVLELREELALDSD